jgi:hypothetical protein
MSFANAGILDIVMAGTLNPFTLTFGGNHQQYPGQFVLSNCIIDVAVYLANFFCGP